MLNNLRTYLSWNTSVGRATSPGLNPTVQVKAVRKSDEGGADK